MKETVAYDFSNKLPISFKSIHFEKNLNTFFSEYISVIDKIEDIGLSTRVKIITDGILECVRELYKGKPKNSYDCLARFMNEAKVEELLNKNSIIEAGTDFFRSRIDAPNCRFRKEELFHIPFELRGKIKTQRFSIPGFPSLYLSNSVYLNWEELQQPEFNLMHCCRFRNSRDLKLLDLTYRFSVSDDVNNYLILYPLKAACAIKTFDTNHDFKSEYIIPQLLMQWINKRRLDGIKYSSTYISKSETEVGNEFYNLVIPVKEIDEEGYCSQLKALFDSTEVVSYYRRSIGWNWSRLSQENTIPSNINPKVFSIGLFKGVRQNYHETVFGVLEHTLKSMDAEVLA